MGSFVNIAQHFAQAPFHTTWEFGQSAIRLVGDTVAQRLFRAASILTAPACYAHLNFELQAKAHILHPESPLTSRALYIARTVGWTLMAPLAIPAIPIRWIATNFQTHPFVYIPPTNTNPQKDTDKISCLSFNVGMIRSGHLISDTGVIPDWVRRENAQGRMSTRFKDVLNFILANPADFICLSEVFHLTVADAFAQALTAQRYHVYHSMGRKAMGPSSGLLFASKLPVTNFNFNPFSDEEKRERARPAGMGYYEATIELKEKDSITVIGTHLSSSQKPDAPKDEELQARSNAMHRIASRINDLFKRVILTGDLNFGPKEGQNYENTSWQNLFSKDQNPAILTTPTWMGDECYSKVPSEAVRLDFTKVGIPVGTGATLVLEVPYNPYQLDPTSVSDHRPIHTVVQLA